MNKTLLTLVLIVTAFTASAQYRQKGLNHNLDISSNGTGLLFLSGEGHLSFSGRAIYSATYQLNPYFSVGGGIGYEYEGTIQNISTPSNTYVRFGGSYIPIFFDLKWYMFKSRITPFVQIKTGGMIGFDQNSGVFVTPVVGVNLGHFVLGLSSSCYVFFDGDNYGVLNTIITRYPNLILGWEF